MKNTKRSPLYIDFKQQIDAAIDVAEINAIEVKMYQSRQFIPAEEIRELYKKILIRLDSFDTYKQADKLIEMVLGKNNILKLEHGREN